MKHHRFGSSYILCNKLYSFDLQLFNDIDSRGRTDRTSCQACTGSGTRANFNFVHVFKDDNNVDLPLAMIPSTETIIGEIYTTINAVALDQLVQIGHTLRMLFISNAY